jgi:hypothetical protein
MLWEVSTASAVAVVLLAVLQERQALQGSGPGRTHRHTHKREVARVDVGHRQRRGGIRDAGASAEDAGKRNDPQSQHRQKADGSKHLRSYRLSQAGS